MLDTVALVGDAAKVYGDVAAQTVEPTDSAPAFATG